MDVAAKVEECFLPPVGSALACLDTQVIERDGDPSIVHDLDRAVTQEREATPASILEALGLESLYRSHMYRWEP